MAEYKRIIVKIGSSSLTHKNGKLNLSRIDKLAMVLSDLANQGKEVVLVSSGAICTGMSRLGLEKKPEDIAVKQAMAAVGQGMLLHIYEKFFAEYGRIVAQILITKEDIKCEERNTNAKNTFNSLLGYGVIPIVNENDTIATHEIKIGDNDMLSAYVAKLTYADLLIILSDVDGLYDRDPKEDGAQIIHEVNCIDCEIEEHAKGAGTRFGTGGMKTKINAAKLAMDSNIVTVIANGNDPSIIYDIISGKRKGTIFTKKEEK